jgi:DNA-binding transcriptional MerR regulator
MYHRNITERIIELQAKGFSAEETRQALQEQNSINIGIATIYRHRTGAIAQEITDELIRQQQRDILRQQQTNPELALKYRNELLKLLIPVKAEILSKNLNVSQSEVKHVIEFVDPTPTSTETPNQISNALQTSLIPLVNGKISDSELR